MCRASREPVPLGNPPLARPRSSASTPLGIAVIGYGYWGVNYVRVFNELAEARVRVVCDQRPERLRELERRYPNVATTTSLEDTLTLDDVDAVVICTEASSHYRLASRCLAAGKHLLIEKPLATAVADAEHLAALAEAAGRVLMVGHTFIYNPGIATIKEHLARQAIGRVYYLYAARTNLGPIRHDVNALWDLAPHDIAIFNYLLDSVPLWVSAVGAQVLRTGREDVGFVSLGYPGGVIGHIHVSWADPYKVREVVVVGSEQRIAFNDLNTLEPVRIFEKGVARSEEEAASYGEHQLLVRDGDIVSPRIQASEPLKNQCSHFLDCVRGGLTPRTSARDGVNVVRVMEAIDRSILQQGAPVLVAQGEHDHGQPASDLVLRAVR